MIDVDGQQLPDQVWHGSTTQNDGICILPAAECGGWWNSMDHETFLNPVFDEDDPDQRAEMDFKLRTSYANIVFEALRSSADPELRKLAEEHGLDHLGNQVGILFVTSDRNYAERTYGPASEIDLDADGVLAAIPDDNIHQAACWILVLRPHSPFPFKEPQSAPSGP